MMKSHIQIIQNLIMHNHLTILKMYNKRQFNNQQKQFNQ